MSADIVINIAENLSIVQSRINAAAERAGRNPAEVTLIAVTKTWPLSTVIAAYEAGLRHFGENRAEELAQKQVVMKERMGEGNDISWHQIGTLQSRKTALVAKHADLFHALDRTKIARRLSTQLAEWGRDLPVFIEVNLSGEVSKSGWNVQEWEENATQREELRNVIQTAADLPGLQIMGLMTMAPWEAAESEIRHIFQRTRALAGWLGNTVPGMNEWKLSMGMTNDFEIAVEEGATHVRVGRALFGSRT